MGSGSGDLHPGPRRVAFQVQRGHPGAQLRLLQGRVEVLVAWRQGRQGRQGRRGWEGLDQKKMEGDGLPIEKLEKIVIPQCQVTIFDG